MTLTVNNADALLRSEYQEGSIDMKDNVRIRIKKATVCGGRKVPAGWVIDASKSDAQLLTGLKKAEKVDPERVALFEGEPENEEEAEAKAKAEAEAKAKAEADAKAKAEAEVKAKAEAEAKAKAAGGKK